MSLEAVSRPHGEPETPSSEAGAPAFRPGPLLPALACAALGLWLAAHHPLSAPGAVAGFVLTCAALARWPLAWPGLLPALLPWLAFAPWSGWIAFEELDLLVLAAAAGGYARWAIRASPARPPPGQPLAMLWCWLLLGLWSASVGLALARGVADAGGWHFDWFEAYRGPMNALRLAKPTLALLLLLPLWLRLLRTPGAQPAMRLAQGLALGLAVTSMVCVWERAAYPGLLNFSTDYRSTGPFWEMHVGGAALDGMLALGMPFMLWQWQRARHPLVWALSAAGLAIGAYASLTTFSRILLVAVPAGMLVMTGLQWRQRGRAANGPADAGQPTAGQWLAAALLWLTVSAAAAGMFPTSGYRGMLALLGNTALLLMVGARLACVRRAEVVAATALVLALAPLVVMASSLASKGPYLVYATVWLVGTTAAWRTARGPAWRAVALACLPLGWASTVLVARHWGGDGATAPAALALLAPMLGLLACSLRPQPPCWPDRWRWQAGLLAGIAVTLMLVGMAGGPYLASRLDTTDTDQQGRWQHWSESLARLHAGAPTWLGVGLGRYLENYAINAAPGRRPGDQRQMQLDGEPAMRLIAGTHVQGWGEMLRMSQRIPRPQGPLALRLHLRTSQVTELHAEVCLKHLLYPEACSHLQRKLPAGTGQWQDLLLTLDGGALPADPWWAPRFVVFSLATESSQAALEVRSVQLIDSQGIDLIRNGNFAQGGARWFFSSDRNHMPWHAKNMAVHLLFEQGRLGLAAMLLLSTAAAWALVWGRARAHPLAPALAGALAGFWVVGMVDSLLDMPRVATLFLLLTAVALTLPAPSPRSGQA